MKEEGNDENVRTALTHSLDAMLHEHRLAGTGIAFDPEESRISFYPSLVRWIFKKPVARVDCGMDVI